MCLHTPTGRPYPSAAQAGPEGLRCNRRCAGGEFCVCPQNPHRASLSLNGPEGPEGLGCNLRCVGGGLHRAPPNPHGASLSLHGPGRTGGTRV